MRQAILALALACAPYQPPPDVARAEARALRGVDTSALAGANEARFHALLASEPCPCGAAHALGDCLRADHCRWARPAARLGARRLAAGESDAEVRDALMRRYGVVRDQSGKPVPPAEFDLTAAPMIGDPAAPVVLVEFSDFECPFCREFAPMLQAAVKKSGGRARLYYRCFPLSAHPHAQAAARAAMAAAAQGKFWEMHHALFAEQKALERADFTKRAADIGLDVERFERDLDDPAIAARVAADRKDGEKHGVRGTPTLFVNGRIFDDDRVLGAVLRWIRDEAP